MLVDCQTCPVRGVRCTDCMVTALSALPIVTTSRPSGPVHDPVHHHVHDPTRELGDGPGEQAEPPSATVPLDRAERRAVSALLAAGLVTTATANAAVAVVERPHQRASRPARVRHAG